MSDCQLPQTYKVQWLAYFLSSLSAHQVNFYEVDHCQLSSNRTTPTLMKKWSSPHCKLSCCWSQSAPCCTCTSRTSPRIGHVWTNLLGLLGFVFLQVYYNQVLFLFCSCPTMMLWPPLKGSLYILTGCRYVSELLPSAWGKTKMMKATKRNKKLPKRGMNTEQNRPDSTSSRHSSKSAGLRSTLAPASSG